MAKSRRKTLRESPVPVPMRKWRFTVHVTFGIRYRTTRWWNNGTEKHYLYGSNTVRLLHEEMIYGSNTVRLLHEEMIYGRKQLQKNDTRVIHEGTWDLRRNGIRGYTDACTGAIFHPRTCMAKRYDINTPQYNPGDTRIQENRRFKEIPVSVQRTTHRTFRVTRLNFA